MGGHGLRASTARRSRVVIASSGGNPNGAHARAVAATGDGYANAPNFRVQTQPSVSRSII
jgi:hypothetical protein